MCKSAKTGSRKSRLKVFLGLFDALEIGEARESKMPIPGVYSSATRFGFSKIAHDQIQPILRPEIELK